MISINSSPASLFARSSYARATEIVGTSLERLATGKRINRGSDDPSGIIAADTLRANVTTLDKQITGLTRTNLSLAATEGHLQVVNDLAQELNGLIVTAANRDALGEGELAAIQTEISSILDGLAFIEQTSTFQGARTLTGITGMQIRAGAEAGEDAEGLNALRAGGKASVIDGDLELAQEIATGFVDSVVERRATIGNQINSNESRLRALRVEFEETTGALSQVEDADFAKEISELTRGQALQQASLTVEAIARQQAEVALGLLRSAASLSGVSAGA
ncbi:MAG: flagellin [Planctomycetota bacterium]